MMIIMVVMAMATMMIMTLIVITAYQELRRQDDPRRPTSPDGNWGIPEICL